MAKLNDRQIERYENEESKSFERIVRKHKDDNNKPKQREKKKWKRNLIQCSSRGILRQDD